MSVSSYGDSDGGDQRDYPTSLALNEATGAIDIFNSKRQRGTLRKTTATGEKNGRPFPNQRVLVFFLPSISCMTPPDGRIFHAGHRVPTTRLKDPLELDLHPHRLIYTHDIWM